jgi:hypothetical protein
MHFATAAGAALVMTAITASAASADESFRKTYTTNWPSAYKEDCGQLVVALRMDVTSDGEERHAMTFEYDGKLIAYDLVTADESAGNETLYGYYENTWHELVLRGDEVSEIIGDPIVKAHLNAGSDAALSALNLCKEKFGSMTITAITSGTVE